MILNILELERHHCNFDLVWGLLSDSGVYVGMVHALLYDFILSGNPNRMHLRDIPLYSMIRRQIITFLSIYLFDYMLDELDGRMRSLFDWEVMLFFRND